MTSGNEGIGVDEAADVGAIITGLQIIEPGILDRALAKTPFLPRPWFSNENQGQFFWSYVCGIIVLPQNKENWSSGCKDAFVYDEDYGLPF